MDEARHTEVFAKYLHTKVGEAYPMSPFLEEQITALLEDSRWDIAYLGMQIVIESLALAAFGSMLRTTEEPLLRKLLRYVMSDEARHVAFGVLSLAEYYQGLTEAELKDRQEFLHREHPAQPAAVHHPEIWERMGVSAEAVVPCILEAAGKAQGQPLCRVPAGLLRQARAQRPQAGAARRQRRLPAPAWGEAGLLEFEFADDTGSDYASYDAVAQDRAVTAAASPRLRRIVTDRTLRGAAALVGVADAVSPPASSTATAAPRGGDDPRGPGRRRAHPGRRRRRVPTPARPPASPSTSASGPATSTGPWSAAPATSSTSSTPPPPSPPGCATWWSACTRPRPRSDRKRRTAPCGGPPGGPDPAIEFEMPVRPAHADGRLRPGRQPPHGRVRDHARAAGPDRGRPPAGRR